MIHSTNSNGRFVVYYTDRTGTITIARFLVSATNPNVADPASRTILVSVPHPTFANHNGGMVAFGPDGCLYAGIGDGGSAGDPNNNAQNLASRLGKLLRIDSATGAACTSGTLNPFISAPNNPLVWGYGLRNPWRFSFDGDDLYIGDVGQGAREEINVSRGPQAGRGLNYGWRLMEGLACFNPAVTKLFTSRASYGIAFRMRCTKAFDARTLSHAALEELRRSAVQRVEAGESPEFVAAGLGLNRRTIYRWLQAYQTGGTAALTAKPIPGAPPKLTAKQTALLARLVREKTPDQLQFPYALWTLAIIRTVIRQKFGVRLSEVSVGRLMKRLGFTPQRPLYRAWQQDPVLVEQWRRETYPVLAAKAKREGALIFFADESGVRSDAHAGTTWGVKGATPVVKATGARFGFNMLSAVSAQGRCRFMLVEGRVTATVFCAFLRRLLHGVTCKIVLIVDGHPVHKAKRVQQFVAQQAGQVELHFLPPYSPDLNPDELAWAHVKTKLGRGAARTKVELKTRARGILRSLQRRPHLVRRFFHAPSCVYAAA